MVLASELFLECFRFWCSEFRYNFVLISHYFIYFFNRRFICQNLSESNPWWAAIQLLGDTTAPAPPNWDRAARLPVDEISGGTHNLTRMWISTDPGWLVVTGCHEFYFPIYWVANHPNWLSYFSEGWPNHQPAGKSNGTSLAFSREIPGDFLHDFPVERNTSGITDGIFSVKRGAWATFCNRFTVLVPSIKSKAQYVRQC